HPATPAIYTLSLHDALPILSTDPLPRVVRRHPAAGRLAAGALHAPDPAFPRPDRPDLPVPSRDGGRAAGRRRARSDRGGPPPLLDRKSTRLNSSHDQISYAV